MICYFFLIKQIYSFGNIILQILQEYLNDVKLALLISTSVSAEFEGRWLYIGSTDEHFRLLRSTRPHPTHMLENIVNKMLILQNIVKYLLKRATFHATFIVIKILLFTSVQVANQILSKVENFE